MSEPESQRQSPKAIIHKQILEVADADPEASIEAIAEDISGATPDLVERVLDTYGDPGEEQPASADLSHKTPSGETDDDSPNLSKEDRTAPQALKHRGNSDNDETSNNASSHPPDSDSDR